MANLERAIQIATEAHEGQFRYDGSPYIEHPLRVMGYVAVQGHSEATRIVGVLHDAVEDSDLTFADLRREGFCNEVINPLELLTKEKGEDYETYVRRLAPNARARVVKRADLFDNLDLTGLRNPPRKAIESIGKHAWALTFLSHFSLPQV